VVRTDGLTENFSFTWGRAFLGFRNNRIYRVLIVLVFVRFSMDTMPWYTSPSWYHEPFHIIMASFRVPLAPFRCRVLNFCKGLGFENYSTCIISVYEGRLKSSWRCGDGLFFEVSPLASDALLTTRCLFSVTPCDVIYNFRGWCNSNTPDFDSESTRFESHSGCRLS
jgi:hypothetical protein